MFPWQPPCMLRQPEVINSFFSSSLPPSLPFLSLARVEFVLTVLAFNGTLVPRESICLPWSYASSCQPRRDWLLQIKDCITCLRGLMRHNYPHHPNDGWCDSVTKTLRARAFSAVTRNAFFFVLQWILLQWILWCLFYGLKCLMYWLKGTVSSVSKVATL